MIIIRIVFLSYNHDLSSNLTWREVFLTMLYGLRMDGSITGYFMASAGLVLTIAAFAPGKWLNYVLATLTIVPLFLSTFIVITDMELYRHWGFRMNTSPLFYISSEAVGSVDPLVIIKLLSVLAALFSFYAFIYMKVVAPRVRELTKRSVKEGLVMLIVSGLMILPIRGSFTVAPMNTGFVYFHNSKAFANHAAINVVWNFLYSIRKSASITYPEDFYDIHQSEKLFSTLYPPSDSTLRIFNTPKPNIVLVILESFTADVIEPLGGVKGIAPNISKLCHEGILFDNFYASGDRTDKGIVCILSGYPAQPLTSIIKYPAKTQHLPQLNPYLKNLGYHSSFIYGGDIDFANFRSYLNTGGFQHLTTLDDFNSELYTSKWGVHDHYMLDKALHELDTARSPFFKVILTLSSHEPFDVPGEPLIKGTDEESLFLNSCHYTDKSIGDFINQCKQKPWWNNTVFVFTADHGHRNPGNKEIKNKERYKIPLLMIGGALTKKDTVIHTMGSQTDIANTLLAQLDKPSPDFIFSKNLLSKNVVPFAVYFFNDGYGFLTPHQYIIHDNTGRQFLRKDNVSPRDIEVSKAYEQMLYHDYNTR
jgi:phosphoglycerol transferase MdoB-like AlkP superfamily enzyme